MSVVAERALLACEQADGNYAVATARWGGTDRALAAVCAGTPPSELSDVSWSFQHSADNFSAVVVALDALTTEVCYRVTPSSTTVFLPLWFGLPLAATTARPGIGALVAVESLVDARTVRHWFRTLKGRVADAVTTGTLPASTAPLVLLAAVVGLSTRERYLSVFPDSAERLSPNARPDGL